MDTGLFFPVPLRVISSSSASVPPGPTDVSSLLDVGDHSGKYIIQNAHGCLAFLFIFPLEGTENFNDSWEADKAATYLAKILGKRSIKEVSFSLEPRSKPKSELRTSSFVVLLPLDAATAGSVPLSALEREDIAIAKEQQRNIKSRWARFTSRNPVVTLGLRIVALATILFASLYVAQVIFSTPEKPWLRYDTRGSQGPLYQLQFSHQNVSEWANENSHEPGQWFLRIDDQAMIPSDLVDEEELQYQDWYQQRYPEMNQIRLDETYLTEDFLGSPYAIQVPADHAFHMSHCVRALRRYWQARETGRHVCPRDIDYRHMKHCLDALDEWAFPPGPRGSVGGMQHSHHHKRDDDDDHAMVDHEDQTYLIWKTKVCFN